MNKLEFREKISEIREREKKFNSEIRAELKEITDRYIEENKPFNIGTVIEVDGKRGVITGFRCPWIYSEYVAGYWKKYLSNGKLSDVERKLTAAELEEAIVIERK